VASPSDVTASDYLSLLSDAVGGFSIGDYKLSVGAIFGAAIGLVLGLIGTRVVQNWLGKQLLPRTELEPSLQQSILTIAGYVGIIAAISLALAQLGIDLQKIAFIAGALSVGIGFGLQAIVSNFVSGLILLTERSIRVGDWVAVKGEEGYVRRIRVRSTEIETFDRASVIIPNADLISNPVKNWTHLNTIGRITVKVGVAYGSDPERVRELLLQCADEHTQVLKFPAPSGLLMNFGDSSLDFELRCHIGDVNRIAAVRSDLNFAVLRKFREAGIEIPYPRRDVHMFQATPADPPKTS
jgi:small-conductance mechanosensitive channel